MLGAGLACWLSELSYYAELFAWANAHKIDKNEAILGSDKTCSTFPIWGS